MFTVEEFRMNGDVPADRHRHTNANRADTHCYPREKRLGIFWDSDPEL